MILRKRELTFRDETIGRMRKLRDWFKRKIEEGSFRGIHGEDERERGVESQGRRRTSAWVLDFSRTVYCSY